jgi:hypothetical protein
LSNGTTGFWEPSMRDEDLLMVVGFSSLPLSLLDARFCLLPLFCLSLLALRALKRTLEEKRRKNTLRFETGRFLLSLALSLRLSPNFERALHFALENSNENLRREMAPHLSKAALGRTSYQRALSEFARKWGLEELLKPLALLMSSLEMHPSEREQALDAVVDDLLEWEREQLLSFSSWLHLPLLTLYSTGILLPMALLPELPVVSAFGLEISTVALLAFLGASLALTYLLGQFLLAKSPLPREPESAPPLPRFVFLLPLAGGLPSIWLTGEAAVWFLLWVPTSLFCFLLWYPSRGAAEGRMQALRMEEELPGVLKQLGSGMARGEPAEEMLGKLRGGGLSELLRRGEVNVRLGNLDLYWSLFDPRRGVLGGLPSGRIRETLSLAISVARRSTTEAGRTLVKFSDHLRQLRRVEIEGKRLLSATLSSMRSLSLFFGPAILAVTARMLLLLQMKAAGLLSLSLNASLLLLALGVYCLGLSWILSSLCHRLEGGDSLMERPMLAKALPLSLALFTVFSLFGRQLVESMF